MSAIALKLNSSKALSFLSNKLYRPTIVYALHRFAQSVINAATASSRSNVKSKARSKASNGRVRSSGNVGKSAPHPSDEAATMEQVQWCASLGLRPFFTAYRADEPITAAIDRPGFDRWPIKKALLFDNPMSKLCSILYQKMACF